MTRRGIAWRNVVLVPVVVAAATWFVTEVPRDSSADAPFEVSGEVGDTVNLGYADLTVTDVRHGKAVSGTLDGARAGGVFVVVDTVWQGTDRRVQIGGAELVDDSELAYFGTDRGGCAKSGTAVPAYPQRITFCFDVPAEAVAGAQVRLGRGSQGSSGAFQQRDAVAVVDLGLSDDVEVAPDEAPLFIEEPGPVPAPGISEEASA
ncbi:hypothetical protein GCM10028784_11710 [Myceligenerans cantabricum]